MVDALVKEVFAILWRRECYNGVTLGDVDSYREGGSHDMGGRVERYEAEAREIADMLERLAAPQVERLRKALQPFADRCASDVRASDHDEAGLTVKVKYLRAAITALHGADHD